MEPDDSYCYTDLKEIHAAMGKMGDYLITLASTVIHLNESGCSSGSDSFNTTLSSSASSESSCNTFNDGNVGV